MTFTLPIQGTQSIDLAPFDSTKHNQVIDFLKNFQENALPFNNTSDMYTVHCQYNNLYTFGGVCCSLFLLYALVKGRKWTAVTLTGLAGILFWKRYRFEVIPTGSFNTFSKNCQLTLSVLIHAYFAKALFMVVQINTTPNFTPNEPLLAKQYDENDANLITTASMPSGVEEYRKQHQTLCKIVQNWTIPLNQDGAHPLLQKLFSKLQVARHLILRGQKNPPEHFSSYIRIQGKVASMWEPLTPDMQAIDLPTPSVITLLQQSSSLYLYDKLCSVVRNSIHQLQQYLPITARPFHGKTA